ncbi:septal ring lytic transglycosylase RlpA family protein [Phenylobacterium sp.]|uniref:septal ring lytic transglycosylase RlpA family protein n=1 Tax=Phenylobacterium sp. TaxID=1871053 RepID=UPI002C8EB529|nr:septal ring lytic transglycosylase RlpA family protein [Phenylobacterium sp.]HLZ76262.1 septal ring lytic transglycosylase RlpA family protein [Phenylobacterium sp.]
MALVLVAGASLAACSTLTTPQYAIQGAGQAGGHGSTVRPPADPSAHGTNAPYQVGGIWYVPHEQPRYDETGIASWYGDAFNMKATANGEIFDMNQFSAAHTTLPLPSMVEVTNLDNGRKLVVRVNDRGPFVGGRIIDLSHAAAAELGYDRAGVAHVRVKYVGPAPLAGPEAGVRYAKAAPPANSAAPAYAPPLQAASYGSGRMTAHRPADEEIFGQAAPSAVAVDSAVAAAPLVAKPKPVETAALTPLPAAPRASRDPFISDVVARRVQPVAQRAILEAASGQPSPVSASPVVPSPALAATQTPPAKGYSIQAGAFSDQTNAKRAAAQLASAGTVKVEPFERSGVTMYRVYLAGVSDEAEAHEVRDKVAAIGFADARVVRP